MKMANDKRKTHVGRREFLKTSAVAALGVFVSHGTALPPQKARELTLYVGTFTSSNSEGIYIYRMDQATGELRQIKAVKSVNPSFLVLDRNKRYLYAVNEVPEFGGKPGGAVSAFAIDSPNGDLRFLNQQSSRGADPCHLTVDSNRKNLLVANYTGGSVAVLPIRRDGSLGTASDLKQHEGSSIKQQQKGPHAHCVILDRSERYALVADLGIDKVMLYRYDKTNGRLVPGKQAWAPLQAGAGPRHLTFHPNGKYAYVINELDSTLSVFQYEESTGTLSLVETVSTLPSNFSGTSFCADVHVSRSGSFLYGSNRGHDSIVVFAIDRDSGRLTQLEHVSTEGKWPRNFTLDPTGKFLLVANQRSDDVVTFKIDSQTGRLQSTGRVAKIPMPVCLRFA